MKIVRLEESNLFVPPFIDDLFALLLQLNPLIKRDDFSSWIAKTIYATNVTVFLAIHEEKPVGCIVFIYYPLLSGFKKSWIEDFVVDKEMRGNGIGSLLLKEVEKFAKEQNISAINLTSSSDKEEAHKFYEKKGFKIIETNYFRKYL